MGKMMTVTYYHHSGFSVSSGNVLLIFDYWTGKQKKLPQDRQIKPDDLARYNEVYVFVSHEHEDHYDPVIYTWEEYAPVTYIIADDMPKGIIYLLEAIDIHHDAVGAVIALALQDFKNMDEIVPVVQAG